MIPYSSPARMQCHPYRSVAACVHAQHCIMNAAPANQLACAISRESNLSPAAPPHPEETGEEHGKILHERLLLV